MLARLKSALLAGLAAALLGLPLLGFRLTDSATGLSLALRPWWVAAAFGVVMAGRFVMDGLRLPDIQFQAPHDIRRQAGLGLTLFAALLPLLPFAGRNVVDMATMVLIYVMLGWGLNIVVGLAGLLDLGFVAFYAVGAYSYALFAQYFHLSFWICLPLAGMLAALFGLVLGFPVLRLRGDYLAIVTLGFGEMIRQVLLNWQSLTGGPRGLSGIPRPTLFGVTFTPEARVIFLYYVILGLALMVNLLALRLRRLPIGRAWEALREDEIACRSLGLNPTLLKLSAFATGAMCAGLAGSFFATRQGFISPESFTFMESAVILAIVVLGGMGSQIGIVLAAVLLVGLPEWFREFQQYRMLAFGIVMVLIMLWRPSGLLSARAPSIRLGPAP